MSVPKDKRTSGELTVNTEARGICTHVLRITGNQKKFPPGQEWFLDRFRETALGIDLDCWKANNIYVDSKERYQERMALQQRAADSCTDMLEMINIGLKAYRMLLAAPFLFQLCTA